MPRAIWSGAISFGLLNVPVKLYSAVSSKTVRFRELREADGSRVRHKRVAENDGEEVSYDEIVKGYELSPDRFVVLTKEELSALDPSKSRAIDIVDFVDLTEIDPIYFNQPYYLAPDTGAAKPYALLAKAMEERGKVAIARFVMRSREHLAAVRGANGMLTLATMRFGDEVVEPESLGDLLPDTEELELSGREVEMAETLIDSLTSDFDPEAYRDEYREQLLDLIERKAEGKDVVSAEPAEREPTAAPDLMAALEKSLAAVTKHRESSGANGGGSADEESAGNGSGSASKSSGSKSKSSSKGSGGSKSGGSKSGSGSKSSSSSKSSGSKSKAKAGSKS